VLWQILDNFNTGFNQQRGTLPPAAQGGGQRGGGTAGQHMHANSANNNNADADTVGLYKARIQLTHSLKAPEINP
jgi:hypothetical protein